MAIGGIGRSCCTYFCFSSSSGLGIRRILKGLDRNARKGVVLRKGMIFRLLILQRRYREIYHVEERKFTAVRHIRSSLGKSSVKKRANGQ